MHLQYFKDFTALIAKAGANVIPEIIPGQINKRMPKAGEQEIAILDDIFPKTNNIRKGQFAMAVGVDIKDTERTIRLLFDTLGDLKIPSAFSLRFVKKSKATLAFTRFSTTCVIGLDGLETKPTLGYLKSITDRLAASDIPHTFHWGKVNFMDKESVKKMYGKDLEIWLNSRSHLLSKSAIEAFSSEYLDQLGLGT